MNDHYSGPTTDTPNKKMNYYTDIKRQKVALCKHFTLPHYIQVWGKVMAKLSGLIYTKPNNSPRIGRRVSSNNGILEVGFIKPFKISLTNLSRGWEEISERNGC